MPKNARIRVSPVGLIVPIAVCVLIGAFTYNIAIRAGFPAALSVIVSVVISLLWFSFFLSRLIE